MMSTSFVRIVLAGEGSFVKVETRAGDDISDLKERVGAKFPHWGTADKLSLYLVAAGGKDEPTEAAISAVLSNGGRLGVGWSLEDAGISSGAWVVARKIADGGATSHTAFLCNSDADGRLHSPQREPYLLSPYAISHVAVAVVQATLHRLAATVLRVGNFVFLAASGMESMGISSPGRAPFHESRVLDGRQPLDCNVGGHLPRRVLDFGLDSGKEE
jgi:hypothetical protein